MTQSEVLDFAITDIERAFSLLPGQFPCLTEPQQWQLIRYYEHLIGEGKNVENESLTYGMMSLSPATMGQRISFEKLRSGPRKTAHSPAIKNGFHVPMSMFAKGKGPPQ